MSDINSSGGARQFWCGATLRMQICSPQRRSSHAEYGSGGIRTNCDSDSAGNGIPFSDRCVGRDGAGKNSCDA